MCLLYCAWHLECMGSSWNISVRHKFWKRPKTFTFCIFLTGCIFPTQKTTSAPSRAFRTCSVLYDLETCFALQWHAFFRHVNSKSPEVLQNCCVFYMFTWKGASHRIGVHLFIILTSTSCPRPSVFNTWGFEICFVPQQHATFHHPNLHVVLDRHFSFTFDFQNAHRVVAHIPSTSQFPKVDWDCHSLYTFDFWLRNMLRATTACNCHLSSGQVALHPPLWTFRNHIIGKNIESWLFYLFGHLHFFPLTLSFLWSSVFFSSPLFSDLTLPHSAFSPVHTVGSLPSKFPSVRN